MPVKRLSVASATNVVAVLLLSLAGTLSIAAENQYKAADPVAQAPAPAPAQSGPPGPEVCKGCHEAVVAGYEKSIHGAKNHPRSPANAGQCSTCHGDGTEHVKAGGGKGVGGIRGFNNKNITGSINSYA